MNTLTRLLNIELSENNEVKKIQLDLSNVWNKQKPKGLNRLSAAYRFFTAINSDGGMLYSDYCEHVDDMRLLQNGKDDFNRFVTKHLNITDSRFDEDLNAKAEMIANAYVKDQILRLAGFIVKVAPLAISND